MEQSNQTYSPTNELTIKDVILTIREWWKYLLSKWLVIVIFGLTGAGLGLTYAYLKKPVYLAELTLVLEDSKSSPLGNYAGLATQFGFDLGGSSGSGVFAGDNILEFLRSRLMVEKTLLSPILGAGKPQSLADYYIDVNKLRESWSGREDLKDIHFPLDQNRSKFTLLQDSILQTIYDNIVKSSLEVSKPDKKLSFIAVRCRSKDQLFSKVFTERLVKEATDFYIKTKTQRSKTNVDLMQSKADSLEFLLNRKTFSVAASQDMNLNPARSVSVAGTEVMARDKIVLQTMYAEVVKNLEISRMSMAQETPLIQIVDTPILPLKKEKFGKLKGLVLGGFLGGFLIVVWLLLRYRLKTIMQ